MANRNSQRRRRNNRVKGANGSENNRRNMKMVVLVNDNGQGQKDSRTQHIPIDSSRPVRFKGHSYLKDRYEQPKNIRG